MKTILDIACAIYLVAAFICWIADKTHDMIWFGILTIVFLILKQETK